MSTASEKVGTSQPTAGVRKTVQVVFIALLLDILAFTIILPLFPRLLEDYREREEGDETTLLSWFLRQIQVFKDITGSKAVSHPKWDIVLLGGALGSLYSLLQFVASPVIGSFSDWYGRRTTLLVTMIGNVLSTFLWLFARSFGWFVWARIVGGLSEGNVQLSIAIVSDVTTQETRSKGLALIGIAFAVSFTVGPALGAYFASKDLGQMFPRLMEWGLSPYSAPAFVALVLLTVETLYLYLFLPETANLASKAGSQSHATNGISKKPPEATRERPKRATVEDRRAALRVLNWIHFLYLFFFAGMEFTLTFLTYDLFDFTNMQNGKLLGYIGILSAVIQAGYVRRRAHAVGEKQLVIQGIGACGVALAIIAMLKWTSNGVMWLYVGSTFLAFTSATVVNCLTALASLQCDDDEGAEESSDEQRRGTGAIAKGQALGSFRSSGQLGRAIGPVTACGLYWMMGSEICYGAGAAAMAIILGIVATHVTSTSKAKVA